MRIAINGFGRIGRSAARIILARPDMELVAINDPSPTELTAQLFEFDSNYGKSDHPIEIVENGNALRTNGHTIRKFTTRNISDLPWGDLNIDVVLECTGVFRTKDGASAHLHQGAKKVLLSAPAKSDGFKTIVIGVNEDTLSSDDTLVSNASCTTNCLAPVVKVLHDAYGINHGFMTTIHSYTNDQRILDVGHKDFRRARAAALNLIPTTTGAAKAVGVVMPELQGKLNGIAVRVPTPTVSLVDATFTLQKDVTKDEVNALFQSTATAHPTVFGYETRPLVSMDYKGDPRSTIVDGEQTMAHGRTLKILSWYDNEWGYACRLVDLAAMMAK